MENTDKTLVVTDVHDNFALVKKIIELEKPSIIIDGGDHSDISFFNYGIETFLIPGNHEPTEILEEDLFKAVANEKNYFLTLVSPGKKYESHDLSIAGFGKNYSNKEWNNKSSKRYMTFTEYHSMKKLKDVDLLITHEAPKCLELFNRGENVGLNYIDDIIKTINPKIAISGHHHKYKEFSSGKTKLISLPDVSEGYGLISKDIKGNIEFEYKTTVKTIGPNYWSMVSKRHNHP